VVNHLKAARRMTIIIREMARMNVNQLSGISYNLHGLNQGASLLNDLLSSTSNNRPIDFCFVQEHWLTPSYLSKLLLFSSKFTFFGKPAMDQAVSNSVLRGRPFGGVGIFLNNNLRSSVLHHVEGDRFVIVVLVNVVLISVYMPAIKSSNDSLTILSMLAEIESCIWCLQ